jgi:prepilin-type N-terminal cleavage/methylation domain-containing protein
VIGYVRAVRARQLASGDDGMTLIEMLVAMFVASILLAGIATVFVGTLRGVTTTNVKTATGADVRIAMEAMSRTVKVATAPAGVSGGAFVSASTFGLSFYALLNRTGADSTAEPVSTLVTYVYDPVGKCLNESRTLGTRIVNPANGGPYFLWPATATQTKCLLRTATAPTFKYYTSGSLAATAIPLADAGLNVANLLTIRSVAINLVATDPKNSTITGIPSETRISLENLIVGSGS